MSMTISIENLRKALRDTNAKAAIAFADAEKLKDGMIAAGVDPTEGEHFEKVDQAYKAYSVLADESAQIEAKLNHLLEIEGISGKAPAGEPKRPIAGDPERKDGTVLQFGGRGRAAERLLASEGYKQLKASGILEMSDARVATSPVKVLERTELKTLITGRSDTQAGAFILADRQTELLELLRRPRVVAGLVNVGDTDSDMIEYVEQTARTNNAAEVAEATGPSDGARVERLERLIGGNGVDDGEGNRLPGEEALAWMDRRASACCWDSRRRRGAWRPPITSTKRRTN